MPTKEELLQQLESLKLDLRGAEEEVARQKRATAAADEVPPEAKALLAAVNKVDLPTFWEADPVLWFRQCESAFRRIGATAPGVKFDHVVGKLPNAVSLSCRSLLLDIEYEDADCYDRLKAHLCKNFGKSKWQLGYALLDSPGLGDRRPSQLLQDMRALLPEKEPEGILFSCLFLKRLPAVMADAILAAGLEKVEDMAAMADRLFDRPAAASTVSAVDSATVVAALANPQRRTDSRRRAARSPDRSKRSPDRRAATPGPAPRNGSFQAWVWSGKPSSAWAPGAKKSWCLKHQFFGDRATTCEPGCSYEGCTPSAG